MFKSSWRPPSILANVDLFRDIDPKELERLESIGRRRQDGPGATIVREGEGSIAMFVVLSGKVRVAQRSASGEERELATIGPGGVFGEMALFSEYGKRSATVTAVEPTELLGLHRLDFLSHLQIGRAHV